MVEVDNGYIWVTPLNGTDPSQKGVRIRTSKQERVQGLSPTATAALGCLLGWGTAANDLLSGTAKAWCSKMRAIVTVPFVDNGVDRGTRSCPALGSRSADLPSCHRISAMRWAMSAICLTIRSIAREISAAKAAERWMDGMTLDDVKEITKDIRQTSGKVRGGSIQDRGK